MDNEPRFFQENELGRGDAKRADDRRLRDEFAMAALTGLISRDHSSFGSPEEVVRHTRGLVASAFTIADLMKAERNKEGAE